MRPQGPTRGRPRGEDGSAVVEFSLVVVMLLTLLLAIVQGAIYLHIRNVTAASAAEGARYAANADAVPGQGAARAIDVVGRGIGLQTASRLRCSESEDAGPGGVAVAVVRCSGALPVFFAPLGEVLPLDVTARAVKEGR